MVAYAFSVEHTHDYVDIMCVYHISISLRTPYRFVFIVVIPFSLIQSGDSSNLKQCVILNNKYNLTHEQIQICRIDTSLFISLVNIGEGEGNLFKQECEYWMADERWNCTGVKTPLFQGTFKPWVNQSK